MAEDADLVHEYFRRVHAGRDDVAELFSPDGQLVGLGTVIAGRGAIAEFYANVIANAGPSPELMGPLMVGEASVAAEITVRVEGAPAVHVIDLFELAGGHIERLTYFVADPGPMP
jgi:hypothetical protein